MRVSVRTLGSLLVAALLAIGGIVIFGGLVTRTSRPGIEIKMLMAQVISEESATASPAPYPTSTPRHAFADCGWVPEANAYVDANANDKWDRGERGLAGVKFYVDDTYNHVQDIDEATSDSHGVAELIVRVLCGTKTQFEVYVVPPDGYMPTTPIHVSEGKPFTFGFQAAHALPGMPGTGHP